MELRGAKVGGDAKKDPQLYWKEPYATESQAKAIHKVVMLGCEFPCVDFPDACWLSQSGE